MELAWVLLLAFAYTDRRVRLLVDALAVKWVLSYFVFLFIGEWAPVLTDIAVGTIAVPLAMRSKLKRSRAFASLFVLGVVAHGLYWSCRDAGLWFPDLYYWTLLSVYTLLVMVLCPWEKLHVRRFLGRIARFDMAFAAYLGFGPKRTRKARGRVTP